MYFNDQQLQKDGKEAFKDKVLRLKSELSNMQKYIKTNEISSKEESKDGEKSSKTLVEISSSIEELLLKTEKLISPSGVGKSSRGLEEILTSLNIGSKEGANDENVIYELMFNKDCKNLMVAAKISELKKRIKIIQR
jgi:hypothetical protein